MKKKENAYDFFKTIHNSLNDVMNAVNHVKCKLKHNVIKCEQFNE